ncbi:unnamed protein product, partial [marine sediment metagenome]
ILLVQPTVQPMTADLIKWFVTDASASGKASSLGVEDRHLLWHDGEVLTERVERQSDGDWPVREMGG